MEDVLEQLQTAQSGLEPRFKALQKVMSALRTATRLAGEEKADAIAMQKALAKLETAAADVDGPAVDAAVAAFAAATQRALDGLAFEFARDLRDEFAARGETVTGRPPILAVGMLALQIDTAARKGQWFYGREPLTRPLPLSLKGILAAYERQHKLIAQRSIDTDAFLQELYQAWQDSVKKRDRRPAGGRINIVEVHAQLTLNRQNSRFWNAPARSTFKDYARALFVRDLTLLRDLEATSLMVDGEHCRFRLGVATKSQAEQASRSIWLPDHGLEGQYYSDITFD
jgi:hypothetical protein